MRSGPPPGEEKKNGRPRHSSLGSPIADPASSLLAIVSTCAPDACLARRTRVIFLDETDCIVIPRGDGARELSVWRLLLWDSGIAVLVLARKF
jgi:hypothetical protein